jgi:hypothetical protein
MNEKKLWNLSTTNIGLYIGLYLGVIGGCLRTSSRKEPEGICLCKQATNVEDSSRTIVIRAVFVELRGVSIDRNGGGSRSRRASIQVLQLPPAAPLIQLHIL